MAGVLIRSDRPPETTIPKDFARWITKCGQCDAYYHLGYSADEAQLEPRRQGTYNKRDQLMHDAIIAVTKDHPLHKTELFIWGPEKVWESIDIVRDSLAGPKGWRGRKSRSRRTNAAVR